MEVVWSPSAIRDLIAIRKYLSRDNPAAAIATVKRIRHLVLSSLRNKPGIGRPGRVPGTRELVITGTPYVVPYRVAGERIDIIRVFHGAQRWPERL